MLVIKHGKEFCLDLNSSLRLAPIKLKTSDIVSIQYGSKLRNVMLVSIAGNSNSYAIQYRMSRCLFLDPRDDEAFCCFEPVPHSRSSGCCSLL